jgi:nucleotide-binding universal stress UspA family protein
MKTFIVPTDFSDTSKNAAKFAVKVASQIEDAHIILYNVFDKVETGSDGSVIYNDHETRKRIMELALESVRIDMHSVNPEVKISVVAEEESSVTNGLRRLATEQHADMIIMGITGATKLAQIFVGSNALSIVNQNICPVMIVPPDAVFTGIKNVLLTSDFKDVENKTPIKSLMKVLTLFNPFVHVLNVDSDHYVELTEEYKAEKAKLDAILTGYPHDYYFMRLFDFVDAINQFSDDNNIDMILTFPKHHSFLGSIFKSSHTKKLAYHSHVPLVAIHE